MASMLYDAQSELASEHSLTGSAVAPALEDGTLDKEHFEQWVFKASIAWGQVLCGPGFRCCSSRSGSAAACAADMPGLGPDGPLLWPALPSPWACSSCMLLYSSCSPCESRVE